MSADWFLTGITKGNVMSYLQTRVIMVAVSSLRTAQVLNLSQEVKRIYMRKEWMEAMQKAGEIQRSLTCVRSNLNASQALTPQRSWKQGDKFNLAPT